MKPASVLSVDDLSDSAIDFILARARQLRGLASDRGSPRHSRLLGLIFLEPSLRSRVGFTAAAARLGWQTLEVFQRRDSPSSKMESWPDTLRIVAGYCDVIVARPGEALRHEDVAALPCSVINGGDVGPLAEHPSQALIDLFAIEQLAGPLRRLRLAIVGDPRMRAARSLLALLARRPPAALTVVADESYAPASCLPRELRDVARLCSWDELADIDVLYVVGMPQPSLSSARREALLATVERVKRLPAHCVLLSPMPVIDEVDAGARRDPRNRMFEQSDLGLYVRMALLEHVTGPTGGG